MKHFRESLQNVRKNIANYMKKPYKSMAEIEKDLKYMGYRVKEVAKGDYIQFLDEDNNSYLLFISDRIPYTIIDVDNDVDI